MSKSLYHQLRAMGHSRTHSLKTVLLFETPFGGKKPVELLIEGSLRELETLAQVASDEMYQPDRNPEVEKRDIDTLVKCLNGQIQAEKNFDEIRFSQKQRERYETALEKLAKTYSQKN